MELFYTFHFLSLSLSLSLWRTHTHPHSNSLFYSLLRSQFLALSSIGENLRLQIWNETLLIELAETGSVRNISGADWGCWCFLVTNLLQATKFMCAHAFNIQLNERKSLTLLLTFPICKDSSFPSPLLKILQDILSRNYKASADVVILLISCYRYEPWNFETKVVKI